MYTNKQTGSATVIGIIVAVVVLGAGAAYFLTSTDEKSRNQNPESTAKTDTTTETESTQTTETKNSPTAELPEGYPAAQAPIYEPSTILIGMDMGVAGWLVTVETADDIDTVIENITENYEALGAKISKTPIDEDGVGQIVASLGGYGTIIVYHSEGEGAGTEISYSSKEQVNRN